jgi:hypothetical protein
VSSTHRLHDEACEPEQALVSAYFCSLLRTWITENNALVAGLASVSNQECNMRLDLSERSPVSMQRPEQSLHVYPGWAVT